MSGGTSGRSPNFTQNPKVLPAPPPILCKPLCADPCLWWDLLVFSLAFLGNKLPPPLSPAPHFTQMTEAERGGARED